MAKASVPSGMSAAIAAGALSSAALRLGRRLLRPSVSGTPQWPWPCQTTSESSRAARPFTRPSTNGEGFAKAKLASEPLA